ncbi:MAG: hypothetical protein ACW96N_06630 [Candidatus Thorarchaeota archaeon]|jgi:hypothetical protein
MSEERPDPIKFSKADLIEIEPYKERVHGSYGRADPPDEGVFLILSYHGRVWNPSGGPRRALTANDPFEDDWHWAPRTGDWLHDIRLLLDEGPKRCFVNQGQLTVIQKV